MKVLNIAAYRFVVIPPEKLLAWREDLKNHALIWQLKGTILLSREGINLFLAGSAENITQFQNFLKEFPEFSALTYRETWSDFQPFKRLLVRLKKEIITMGRTEIRPERDSASYIKPQTLKQWYQEGREMLLLDTRNQYEVQHGTFVNACHLNLKNFRHFPEAITQLPQEAKNMPVVTFCTGGIRCEKAALWLQHQGYAQVYQLQGGILNYFAQCGRDYFNGECFVFDERIAI